MEATGRAAADAEEAAAAMVEAVVVDMVVAASGAVGVHAAEAAVASVDVEDTVDRARNICLLTKSTCKVSLCLPCFHILCPLAMGAFVHAAEGDMVCKSINEKIPYFNAPIYLENKTPIGRVDEILGPINQSVCPYTVQLIFHYIVLFSQGIRGCGRNLFQAQRQGLYWL